MSQIFDIVEELEKERKKNKKLKERIDKAIEYIKWDCDKNEELIDYLGLHNFYDNLLNILRGEDK